MIEINNLTEEFLDEKFFRQCALMILKNEKKKDIDLSIAFVDANEIKRVNKKYRNKNKTTDVLSFGEFEFRDFLTKEKQDFKKFLKFAEIIICVEEIKKKSAKFNLIFNKEIKRVFIHGILHILGYVHEKNIKQARIMKEKENYYLSLCEIKDKN
ncbi:MAG: rRNA maturation RNase YbeY [Patescibacteria group bacterium]|nr:rRNA maturation RNase YbeY [Patescibacteria group bacterium]